MTTLDDYTLSDRYTNDDGTVFLSGVQALVRLPIEQLRLDRANGVRTAAFVSGYQGSPLGGFDMEMARAVGQVADLPIVCRPAVNEELAATAVMGSQLANNLGTGRYDGVVGVWYGKAPGLDRAGDAIRHGVYAGAGALGGAVALVGDDPACKSSTLPSSSDMGIINLRMPMLYPGDVQEVLELSRHAVALSRFCGQWTAIKVTTAVADGTGTVSLDSGRSDLVVPDSRIDGVEYRPHPNGNLIAPFTNEMEREITEVRLPLARRYSEANGVNTVTAGAGEAWIGIVAAGYTYRETVKALGRLGFATADELSAAGIRLMHLKMPFPLAAQPVLDFARGLEKVMVVEEKGPALEWLIKDLLFNQVSRPRLVGAGDEAGGSLIPQHGFLTAEQIEPALRRQLEGRLGNRLKPDPGPERERVLIPLSTQRSPYFCSGCPHNWGTKVPEGSTVGAGIGCSGMALLMESDKVGDITGITCMGGEGVQWVGMEPFVDTEHFIQNLGDGTFFHSGQLALQAAVAAGVHMTYKLLYNGTVAMTGGQDPEGHVGVPEIAAMALAHGVTEVVITTDDPDRYRHVELPTGSDGAKIKVWDRTRIVEAQEHLAAKPGVTVLIHDQACAAQTRRLRKRGLVATPGFRVAINQRLCEACGHCGEVSNCLSVHTMDTDLGPKTVIDQTSCNLDFSCLNGDCPSFMTVEIDDDRERGRLGSAVSKLRSRLSSADEGDPLPDPPKPGTDAVNIRFAGIGGTGVVTVAQILGTAAMLDGWSVRGLDQTGLSQKAGPVISDLRLSRAEAPQSNLIGDGEADVILGFDLLVAVSDRALAAASQDRTVMIASAARTPTGQMIGRPEVEYPSMESMTDRASGSTRSNDNRFVDAAALTRSLLGDAATANVFLLGAAAQAGALPVSPDALERAIELNGVAVDANRRSFQWGRRWVVDPTGVEQARRSVANGAVTGPSVDDVIVKPPPVSIVAAIEQLGLSPELHERVSFLAADLVEYQDEPYSRRFVDFIGEMAAAEHAVSGDDRVFALTVADGLHKLMAYKDEYEVARLLLAPEADAMARSIGGERARVSWRLHPPMLRALGMTSKLAIDTRVGKPMMRVLAEGKRLRGTRLDPFGYAHVRRVERQIIDDYRRVMTAQAERLTVERLSAAADLARSAMDVRGYEDIKLKRVEKFQARLDAAE